MVEQAARPPSVSLPAATGMLMTAMIAAAVFVAKIAVLE